MRKRLADAVKRCGNGAAMMGYRIAAVELVLLLNESKSEIRQRDLYSGVLGRGATTGRFRKLKDSLRADITAPSAVSRFINELERAGVVKREFDGEKSPRLVLPKDFHVSAPPEEAPKSLDELYDDLDRIERSRIAGYAAAMESEEKASTTSPANHRTTAPPKLSQEYESRDPTGRRNLIARLVRGELSDFPDDYPYTIAQILAELRQFVTIEKDPEMVGQLTEAIKRSEKEVADEAERLALENPNR